MAANTRNSKTARPKAAKPPAKKATEPLALCDYTMTPAEAVKLKKIVAGETPPAGQEMPNGSAKAILKKLKK